MKEIFYEKLYGKEKSGRAEMAACGRWRGHFGPNGFKNCADTDGKNKPTYTPHVDTGDYVIVLNADKVRVTGKKAQMKEYEHYTHYPGGRKITSFADLMEKKPERVVELAVKRMLPKNKIGRAMFKKLKVYRGSEHEHQAQKPEKIELF